MAMALSWHPWVLVNLGIGTFLEVAVFHRQQCAPLLRNRCARGLLPLIHRSCLTADPEAPLFHARERLMNNPPGTQPTAATGPGGAWSVRVLFFLDSYRFCLGRGVALSCESGVRQAEAYFGI